MIVISGALVLVALVLLVLGLTMTDLDFVYGSIGVSLVSFVFLVIGILQRRGEQPATAGAAPEATDSSTAPQMSDDAAPEPEPATARAAAPASAAPAARTARVPVPVVEEEDDDEELEPGGGTVLVVPGRPRYHLEGCRYLAGKDAEPIDVLDAREDGFTPCGVCKPDAALEAMAAEYEEPVAFEEPVEDDVAPLDEEPAAPDDDAELAPVVDTGVPGTADDVDAVAAPARPRRTSRTARGSAKLTPPSPDVTAADTADTSVDDTAEPATDQAPPLVAVAPPRSRARSKATPSQAPAKPVGRGKVVIIPDRGRFHTPSCRFVRNVLGTEELSRAQATKQGFKSCGVCKP